MHRQPINIFLLNNFNLHVQLEIYEKYIQLFQKEFCY